MIDVYDKVHQRGLQLTIDFKLIEMLDPTKQGGRLCYEYLKSFHFRREEGASVVVGLVKGDPDLSGAAVVSILNKLLKFQKNIQLRPT